MARVHVEGTKNSILQHIFPLYLREWNTFLRPPQLYDYARYNNGSSVQFETDIGRKKLLFNCRCNDEKANEGDLKSKN